MGFFKAHTSIISIIWGGGGRKLAKYIGYNGTRFVLVRSIEVWGYED